MNTQYNKPVTEPDRYPKMIRFLHSLSQSRLYWLFYATAALLALALALYHQHVLNEPPCVVCIQVRLLMTVLVLVSVLGFFSLSNRLLNSVAHLMTIATALALAERSYLLLGTERGFVFADCGFNLGLPDWFAIEDWFPAVYRVETSCGYTPEIAFGITMAEALMVASVIFVCLSSAVFVSSFFRTRASVRPEP